jgi:hypothetical protein
MSTRTVPKRIVDFLLERRGRSYCDACIQERLGLKWRQQVQLITATLAVTDSYERGLEKCSTCSETKQVIFACVDVAVPAGRRVLAAGARPLMRVVSSAPPKETGPDNELDRPSGRSN